MVKRGEITKEMVESAIAVYYEHAYGTKPRKKADGPIDVFRMFVDETRKPEGEVPPLERYSMRLGNRNYPFMKLVLQEHVVPGEFYFAIDTHDQMDIRPDFPDYEAWMKVKRFNLGLKSEIEAAMTSAGLPTLCGLRDMIVPGPYRKCEGKPLILVVDDEEAEARTLEAVLRREGYDVSLAFDGREALERLTIVRPSLIVLDYEMPELDGLGVIHELRSHRETRSLPILLTTASEVLQGEKTAADGFLAKPFRSVDLLSLVERLLAK